MEKKTTNQVRQVLMNELGFTRESVREEMKNIVHAEVVKLVERISEADGMKALVQASVTEAVNSLAKKNRHDSSAIRDMVVEAAKVAAADFITKNIRISAVGDIIP